MNIYFSGIGGVGIGPLAEIALDAGYSVAGSDRDTTLITKELDKRGVVISNDQDGTYLLECHQKNPIDWFVYTSALSDDHPELSQARKLGIKTAKRDELIAHILDDKKLKLIAIAGTHGKTTVTGMMIWAMKQLNIPVSYSIGTTITYGPSGQLDKNSDYFIYECDEFDRNFLHFKPYLSLITSIDYDHPDTYPTIYEYLDAFHEFAKGSEYIITWNDQHSELFHNLPNATILDPKNINNLSITGQHNRRNITLVQEGLRRLGYDNDTNEILSRFPGTNRRMEKLADNLYSDYGHHPTEIAATLQLARELSDHIMLVYQPHQNVRQHKLCDLYTDQFELADKIFWLPTYLSREDPDLEILQPKDLIKGISNKNDIEIAQLDDTLWAEIKKALDDGMLVLCMGAGSIDGWIRDKINRNKD
jgi:UDP-N-acetylmuramate--alanine ligase